MKYKISLTTAPPTTEKTEEEVEIIKNRAIDLLINELLLNNNLKIGK